MNKMNIKLDLKDQEYARRLAAFLKTHYQERIRVYEAGEETEQEVVWLTDQEGEKQGKVIRLGEGAINPYQSIHQIMRQIWAEQEKETLQEENAASPAEPGRWISVYGYAGGSGKSTLALSLALELTARGKVLYLSLEGPSASYELLEAVPPYTLSDMLYCFLLQDEAGWHRALPELLAAQGKNLHVLAGGFWLDDMQELLDKEILAWMQRLKMEFDYLVADLGIPVCRAQRFLVLHSDMKCRLWGSQDIERGKYEDARRRGQEEEEGVLVFSRGDMPLKQTQFVNLPDDPYLYEISSGNKKRLNEKSEYRESVRKAVQLYL